MSKNNSERARHDMRLSGHPKRKDSTIYNDDFLYVVSPLTWAAAVRFGWDGWAWANPQHFEDFLLAEDAPDYLNEWKKRMEQDKVYVYIAFKVAVPKWLSFQQGNPRYPSLTNLALEFDTWSLPCLPGSTPDKWRVWDEENHYNKTIRDVKQMIRSEPTRQDTPEEEENVPLRGANVLKTPEEAETVVAHLEMAIQAIIEWGKDFDLKRFRRMC